MTEEMDKGKLLNITAYRHSPASREALLAVMEWLDLAQKDPERWPGLETLLFNLLAARERAVLDDVLVYANMRGMIADQSKHVEHLAGNIVKEAREDGARAELFGLEQWARQQAEAVKP